MSEPTGIQRYEHRVNDVMYEDSDGDYVLYADHVRVREEYKQSLDRFDEIVAELNQQLATAQAALQGCIDDICQFEKEMEERHGMEFTDDYGARWQGEVVTQYIYKARAAYNELIMAVGKKYQGETRHQTALRYIQQAEQAGEQQAQQALGKEAR